MNNNKIKKLRNEFSKFNIDGYIIPKNDEFFSEYATIDRLKNISNFSGSAGLAVILKKKNYLFVDGRYTLQAQKQSGKDFKIVEIHKTKPKKILGKNKNKLIIGFDPKLYTQTILSNLFLSKNVELIPIKIYS